VSILRFGGENSQQANKPRPIVGNLEVLVPGEAAHFVAQRAERAVHRLLMQLGMPVAGNEDPHIERPCEMLPITGVRPRIALIRPMTQFDPRGPITISASA